MPEDFYGNPVSTASQTAADAYADAMDLFLTARAGAEAGFQAAIDADPGFTLAHMGLARCRQSIGDGAGSRAAFQAIKDNPGALDAREASHFHAFSLLLSGDVPGAYKAIRQHAVDYPRDGLIVQTCMGVFGLIGFSGLPGREAEQLAFAAAMAPHYPDDSWFQCQYAFAMSEAGQVAPALPIADRAYEMNTENAHAAHVRAHVLYEAGEAKTGYDFISGWRKTYDKNGALHCHVSWHEALWALEHGDIDRMWQVIDADVAPGKAWGPALNVVTDTAAILYRASIMGVDVPGERWAEVSAFANKIFPKPGIAFGDAHAALAHAMAGDRDALDRIKQDARGPAAEVVRQTAAGFEAVAAGRWAEAIAELGKALVEHERLGGSRAQRDLLEFAYVNALLRLGQADEAKRHIAMRRPQVAGGPVAAGLH